jgi:ribosomal protein S18 acetylase RimI-like enzyme
VAQLTEAAMLRLDDPHYDALIAIKDSAAIAHVGVLAVGEIGAIYQLCVTEALRRRGFGTVMMSRAMEICARSLFKHVFLGVTPSNTAAIQLYTKFGFRKIGEWVEYQKV